MGRLLGCSETRCGFHLVTRPDGCSSQVPFRDNASRVRPRRECRGSSGQAGAKNFKAAGGTAEIQDRSPIAGPRGGSRFLFGETADTAARQLHDIQLSQAASAVADERQFAAVGRPRGSLVVARGQGAGLTAIAVDGEEAKRAGFATI